MIGNNLEGKKLQKGDIVKEMKLNRRLYLLMAPFFLLFIVFTVFPVLFSVIMSFTDFNVLQAPNFIGLNNYRDMFLNDDIFLKAVQNTFIIAVIIGPLGYMLSFMMAWLLNELPPVLRAILTVIFYSPSMAGNAYMIWTLIFSGDSNGYLNAQLISNGIVSSPVLWLTNEKTMLIIVIMVQLWLSMGVGFLSFIAGLQGVDRAQLEAGEIDGIKNRWQELWYIVLPSMKPQLLFGAVMAITSSLSVADVTAALCGFPSTGYAAHTIVNHLSDYGMIRLELGYASAIAVVLFFIMMIANVLVQKFIRRVGT